MRFVFSKRSQGGTQQLAWANAPAILSSALCVAAITTMPNELCAELHNRMPVVVGPATWPAWLGEEPAEARQLKAMLAAYPSEGMTCWPVSTRVGNVKNNDPNLIEPAP
jgi:putative SOS response-associated peptidase YedK